MGRKIPARKHHGVRDPEKQHKLREAKLRFAREDAPPNANDQPIPKKLAHILKLSQMVQEGTFKEKKKNNKPVNKNKPSNYEDEPLLKTDDFVGSNGTMQPGMKRPLKPLPTLTQRPGERKRNFLYRINQWCNGIVKESQFENQYGVDIVRDEETGQVQALQKRKKDEIDVIAEKEVQKARATAQTDTGKKPKKSKKKLAEEAAAKEDRKKKNIDRMKRKRTKILQKAVKREEEQDNLPVREIIKFGEVADRPPEFTVLPRKAVEEKNLKNLMFNQMLMQGQKAEKESKAPKSEGKVLKKSSGKLRDLPPGERRIIEQQQKAAIAAYRLMKINKAKE